VFDRFQMHPLWYQWKKEILRIMLIWSWSHHAPFGCCSNKSLETYYWALSTGLSSKRSRRTCRTPDSYFTQILRTQKSFTNCIRYAISQYSTSKFESLSILTQGKRHFKFRILFDAPISLSDPARTVNTWTSSESSIGVPRADNENTLVVRLRIVERYLYESLNPFSIHPYDYSSFVPYCDTPVSDHIVVAYWSTTLESQSLPLPSVD
jgi:hypothetical protein